MPAVRVLTVRQGESLPADVARQVVDAQTEVYGSAAEHDPALAPETSVLFVDGTVVAVVDVLTTRIEHAGTAYVASGLSWVLTAPLHRGLGHARRLVQAVHDRLAGAPVDLVIFTCDRPLQHLYESAGFEVLPGTVLVGGTPADPFPSDSPGFDKVTLAAFVSSRARDRRTDFAGARIGLYPGLIDRLW